MHIAQKLVSRVLIGSVLLASQAMATVCNGPNLANITVLPNGVLEVHGTDRVARSSDNGRTWETIPGLEPSPNPFWKRTFKDTNGTLYQNVIVSTNTLTPIVIFSTDQGRIWEQKHFEGGGLQSLIVWADAKGLFRLYANDLLYSEFDKAIGQGTLEGLHGAHEVVSVTSSAALSVTYTTFIDTAHRFVSFDFDGTTLRQTFSESWVPGASIPPVEAIVIGPKVTGLFIAEDRTLYISTLSKIVRGRNLGESWDEVSIPKGWVSCSGDPPRATNSGR